MVRGRATVRGTRRGGAADQSQPAETTDADTSTTAGPSTAPDTTGTATRGSPSTRARGSTGARGTRGASTGRFRPKNIRRDEAERDNLARQEEQKAKERWAEEQRNIRGRSRFRSKRSRGDTMGSRGGFGRIITSANGPFSGGTASGGFRVGGRTGFGGFGSGGGYGGSGSRADSKTPGFNQSDAVRLREARINADKLHAMTPYEELDSEDEAMRAALGDRKPSAMPMGIYRRAHKETEIVVATTAELEAAENAGEEESLWVDGEEDQPIMAQPAEEGTWETDLKKPVSIKKEPEADGAMDIDSAVQSAAEATKKAAVIEQKPKKALPQEPEDKEILTDMQLLATELGATTIAEDGETRTEGPANKDGRLYLLQFPPLLPPLQETAASSHISKVKEEPQQESMVDAPARTSDSARVDLTQEEADNSARDGADVDADEHGFMSDLLSQGGLIGKLNVRKSGKVELDWGGRILQMSPATAMNFLTTAVIVEENDEKPQTGVIGGESIGMGKIMGRFVLAPVWGEDEEWDVEPDELIVS